MGHQLYGGDSSWCPKLDYRATHLAEASSSGHCALQLTDLEPAGGVAVVLAHREGVFDHHLDDLVELTVDEDRGEHCEARAPQVEVPVAQHDREDRDHPVDRVDRDHG